jgi:hypothetical protein
MSPYVMRQGKRIEVVTLNPPRAPNRRRKPFETQFVQVPKWWITALSRVKNLGTWRLAMVILAEDFKRQHLGGEIVLSARMTGIPQTTRRRATRELVGLGLIQLAPGLSGMSAPRVLTVRKSKAP